MKREILGSLMAAVLYPMCIGSAAHGAPFPIENPAPVRRRHRINTGGVLRTRNKGNGLAAACRPAWLQIELKKAAEEKRIRRGRKLARDYAICLASNPCAR